MLSGRLERHAQLAVRVFCAGAIVLTAATAPALTVTGAAWPLLVAGGVALPAMAAAMLAAGRPAVLDDALRGEPLLARGGRPGAVVVAFAAGAMYGAIAGGAAVGVCAGLLGVLAVVVEELRFEGRVCLRVAVDGLRRPYEDLDDDLAATVEFDALSEDDTAHTASGDGAASHRAPGAQQAARTLREETLGPLA